MASFHPRFLHKLLFLDAPFASQIPISVSLCHPDLIKWHHDEHVAQSGFTHVQACGFVGPRFASPTGGFRRVARTFGDGEIPVLSACQT